MPFSKNLAFKNVQLWRSSVKKSELKKKITRSLRRQGFRIKGRVILPPSILTKDKIRQLHATAVEHRQERSREGLFRREPWLLSHIASGNDVSPEAISPRLVEVFPASDEELLFRYISLHWSIPVSSGYGRRLRFLVIDDANQKLIGIIGLGDPVIALSPRDSWIGWNRQARETRLRYVMDAFVLGSVPPYSELLCGKLVAMLAASDEIREAFKKKYGGTRPLIRRTVHDGRLALITTTSALGRSSVYNRIRFGDRRLYHSVGFTGGSGEFHFSNGLYSAISEFAANHCTPTYRRKNWGDGFRNRREVLKKALPMLGLPSAWLKHGVEREVFMIPLARNSRQFLCGDHTRLQWFSHPAQDICDYFRERWLLPRSSRDDSYRSWSREQYGIWRAGES
jgi:hypothetical protein